MSDNRFELAQARTKASLRASKPVAARHAPLSPLAQLRSRLGNAGTGDWLAQQLALRSTSSAGPVQAAPTYLSTAVPKPKPATSAGTIGGPLAAATFRTSPQLKPAVVKGGLSGGPTAAPTYATSPPSTHRSAPQVRPLTPQEIAYAAKFFGTTINYKSVVVVRGSGGNPIAKLAFRTNPAITLSSVIYIRDGYSDDFTKPGADTSLFMHEMTHVWQYGEMGVPAFLQRYATEFIFSGFKAGEMYDYKAGTTTFARATLEAQAAMVGDYHDSAKVGSRALIEGSLLSSPWLSRPGSIGTKSASGAQPVLRAAPTPGVTPIPEQMPTPGATPTHRVIPNRPASGIKG